MPILPVRLVVAVASCLFVAPAPAPAPAATAVCPARGDAVVVDAQKRQLSLCAAGAAAETFPVALGTGGLGKQRMGDNRTPLGAYPLGMPRPSGQFGTFIPVGYPTAGQLKAGFTGSAVGIHGPLRAYAWAGAANTLHDWTAGCIAVSSDAEIGRIAAWVRTHRPLGVHIVASAGADSAADSSVEQVKLGGNTEQDAAAIAAGRQAPKADQRHVQRR